MVKVIKMAFVLGALFISFCDVIFLQAGGLAAALEKRHEGMCIGGGSQSRLHEQHIIFAPISGEIDELEKWQLRYDERCFWIRAKAIRDVLVGEWDKMPKEPKEDERELIKNYIEAIFRLDGILDKRSSLVFRILRKRESNFFSELEKILELLK